MHPQPDAALRPRACTPRPLSVQDQGSSSRERPTCDIPRTCLIAFPRGRVAKQFQRKEIPDRPDLDSGPGSDARDLRRPHRARKIGSSATAPSARVADRTHRHTSGECSTVRSVASCCASWFPWISATTLHPGTRRSAFPRRPQSARCIPPPKQFGRLPLYCWLWPPLFRRSPFIISSTLYFATSASATRVRRSPAHPDNWKRVIGVVSGVRHAALDGPPPLNVYLAAHAFEQAAFLVVRTEGPTAELGKAAWRAKNCSLQATRIFFMTRLPCFAGPYRKGNWRYIVSESASGERKASPNLPLRRSQCSVRCPNTCAAGLNGTRDSPARRAR